jgi:four helix bundle protein
VSIKDTIYQNVSPSVKSVDGHRHLVVWQRARDLVLLVYKVTDALPRAEEYVVKSQLRRAAWSVQNNIAEGNAKLGGRERRRLFDIAIGSLAEVDSMVATVFDLYRLDDSLLQQFENLRREINGRLFSVLNNNAR